MPSRFCNGLWSKIFQGKIVKTKHRGLTSLTFMKHLPGADRVVRHIYIRCMTFLHVFYTLRSCRSVFWWLAVPWWARNEISVLSVSLTPLCITLWWQSLIMSLVVGWSHGNHAGNLAVSGRDEWRSLPLHLKIPFISLIIPSWAHCCLKFGFSDKDPYIRTPISTMIHWRKLHR